MLVAVSLYYLAAKIGGCNTQCFNCLKANILLVGLEIMKAVHAMPESNNIIIIEVEALSSFLCINRLLDPFLDWL